MFRIKVFTKSRAAVAPALSLLPFGAAANVSLLNSTMYAPLFGQPGTLGVLLPSGATIETSVGGSFSQGSNGGSTGLGVNSGVGDTTTTEIDVDESIILFGFGPLTIADFSVALLYNGPEIGDWTEIAKVTATATTGTMFGTLSVDGLFDNQALWSFGSGVVVACHKSACRIRSYDSRVQCINERTLRHRSLLQPI